MDESSQWTAAIKMPSGLLTSTVSHTYYMDSYKWEMWGESDRMIGVQHLVHEREMV